MTKIHILLLILAGVVFLTAVVFKGYIIAAMHAAKLLPEPETFTELYFDNHIGLPAVVELNQKQSFSFTVHNLENKTMQYPIEIYIDTEGKKQMIAATAVTLPSGGYKTLAESFALSTPSARSKVVVNLINKNQPIDFWIETNPSPTGTPTPSPSEIPTLDKNNKH